MVFFLVFLEQKEEKIWTKNDEINTEKKSRSSGTFKCPHKRSSHFMAVHSKRLKFGLIVQNRLFFMFQSADLPFFIV